MDELLWERIRAETRVVELQESAQDSRGLAVVEAVARLRGLAEGGSDWHDDEEDLVQMAVGQDGVGISGNLWEGFLEEEERGRQGRWAAWVEDCCREWYSNGGGCEE